VNPVRIAERQDRDTEFVEFPHLAVLDTGLVQSLRRRGQFVERSHRKAEVIQTDPFGNESIRRVSDGPKPEEQTSGLEHHTAVQLRWIVSNPRVAGIAGATRRPP
jgi:hypothetical protein